MKKILTLILILILSTSISWAKHEKEHYLNFNGAKYRLLYSTKNADFGGYLNEYFKYGETYNVWSEMIAVHHFPNAYSPIDQIKALRDYLESMNCPSALTYNDKDNTAMIDFVMINSNQLPIVLEFNVFKYEKSDECGSVALQYVKRYAAKTAFQLEAAKADFEKSRKKLLNKVKNYNTPQIIAEEIDKCRSAYETKEEESQTPTEEVVEENIVPVSEEKPLEQETNATEEENKIEENEVTEIEEEHPTGEVEPKAIPEPAAEQPAKEEVKASDKVKAETKQEKEPEKLEEITLDTKNLDEDKAVEKAKKIKEEPKAEKPAKPEKVEKVKEEKQNVEKAEKQKAENVKEEKQKVEKPEKQKAEKVKKEKQKAEKTVKQKKEKVKKPKAEKPKKVSAKKRAKDAALKLVE